MRCLVASVAVDRVVMDPYSSIFWGVEMLKRGSRTFQIVGSYAPLIVTVVLRDRANHILDGW